MSREPFRRRSPRRLALLRGVGFVAALAVPAFVAGSALASSPSSAERAAWLEDLRDVWRLVNRDFFDEDLRGVDWPAALRHAETAVGDASSAAEAATHVNEMLARLGTSHTRLFTEDDLGYYFLLDLFRDAPVGEVIPERFASGEVGYVGIGVFTERLGAHDHVIGVVDGSPAAKAGLLVGDRLVSVEGRSWHPIRRFRDREGTPTRIVVQRTPDPDAQIELEVIPVRVRPVDFYLEALQKSARLIEHDGRTIAYVRPWSYAGKQNQDALEQLVLFGELSSADALIVDLRDGWGGASPSYLNLFNPRVPVLTSIPRDGEASTFDSQWRKPVALLVNGGTRSGKELLAFGFRRYGYGPVVGTRTAGAVTAGRAYAIGESWLLYLAVRDALVDGERLEGRGVEPDLVVPFDRQWAAGEDPQLAAALDRLTREDVPEARR